MYGSARKSYLQMLDTVHHQGLRLALGAFRTSPVTSLYVEADEPSLYLRREKLSLQYAIRLAANQRNPAFKVTFSPQFLELYEHKPNAIKPFGLRILPLLESSNINPNNIEKHFIREWVKCVTRTRTRAGKPALGFYESLKNIYSSKTIAVKAQH